MHILSLKTGDKLCAMHIKFLSDAKYRIMNKKRKNK